MVQAARHADALFITQRLQQSIIRYAAVQLLRLAVQKRGNFYNNVAGNFFPAADFGNRPRGNAKLLCKGGLRKPSVIQLLCESFIRDRCCPTSFLYLLYQISQKSKAFGAEK